MKTIILLKARLRSNLISKEYLRDLRSRKQLWVLAVAGISILIAAASFGLMLIQNYKAILSIGVGTGEPELLILISGILSSILVFFFATPLCLSNIFYSKDNLLAAALPVSSAEIIFSRVLSVYLFILPLHLLITLPAAVIFLPAAGTAMSVLSMIIYSFIGPAVPLAAAIGASALLSAAGNLTGRRTAVETAGMIIAIIIAIMFQIYFSRSIMASGDITAISEVLTGYTVLLKKIFFASAWTASGFTAGGWPGLMLSLAFSAAVITLTVVLMKKIRLNFSSLNHGRPGRRRRNHESSTVQTTSGSQISALVKREWTVVKSNSAFLIEIAGETVILPIMLIMFYFTMPDEIFSVIRELSASFSALPLAAFGVMVLISSINSVSSTSISREGETFALSKSLPVTGRTQIKAKLIFHLMLFLTSWYINLIILSLILKIPAVHLLYLIPAGPAVVVLEFASMMHIDLSRPVLKWTHPQQAMKQNMNVLIGMGFGLIVFASLALPAAGLYFTGLNPVIIGLIITVEAAAADFLLIPKILDYSERRYIEISV